MDNPVPFADLCRELGRELPAQVTRAIDRYRAIDTAIRSVAGEPAAEIDMDTVEPEQAEDVVRRVIEAQQRRDYAHCNAANRLLTLANISAVRTIRAHADDIVTALRPEHDRIARKLADGARLLNGVRSETLAAADAPTRAAWIERPALLRRIRAVRSAREALADVGYRLPPRDTLGTQLELLTRYVDAPSTMDTDQMRAWYEFAERCSWDEVLADGGRLWLPTVDEQRERVERLRTAWINRKTGARS